MNTPATASNPIARLLERIGRSVVVGIEAVGFTCSMFAEAVWWLLVGWRRKQPVRIPAVFAEMMDIGILALPILGVLSATIGMMLAIQGIYQLRQFGAESQVVLGVAFSVVREFAPLITGILVAGRSGSALAARLATMKINQEVDALWVMGIMPVRFLVAPPLLAMVIMLPLLTFFSMVLGLLAAGFYISADLGMSLPAYFDQVREFLSNDDFMHGIGKSLLFAVAIAMIGVANGASVTGGAEGVGRVTTRSVVHAISAIVIIDMLFAFMATR
ncbi:MAG: ABC transporter permease [Chromatiales bacterium]|jgi:phospholipid/cholesterol/gamma-HCH transport system permease protein|nr:ABC transporter permease [Chromatiales bacterium]MDX9766799.1 ABC transporter permease [Ectothiorhodospiraceae bacterium]